MSKATFGILISAALFAGAAFAQSAAPTPSAPATPASAAAVPATAAPAGKARQVEGVTVMGKRPELKACSSRDDKCVAMVVAELKQRYPKELQKWCEHVEERAAMNTIMFMEIDPDRPHPNVGPYMPPAVTKSACAPDKKH
jgi:hypothetical protein